MARAHGETSPDDADLDNGAAITTGNKIIFASNRTVYAVWFYRPTTSSGTYTVALYEVTTVDDPGPGAGTLLASGSVAHADTAAGWNRVELSGAQAVVTTKVYAAVVHASNGRFVRTAGALGSAGITANGITIVQSGTDPIGLGVVRNGTFNEGAAVAYPSSVFGTPDYFTDLDDEPAESEAVTGEGSPTSPRATATASGTATVRATAGVTSPRATATASATVRVTGTGSATSPTATVVATGAVPVSGVGSATSPRATATAAGLSSAPVAEAETPGSWYGLLAVLEQARAWDEEDQARVPWDPRTDPMGGGWE